MFEIPINLITSEPQMKFFAPTWMQLPEDFKKIFRSFFCWWLFLKWALKSLES